MAMAADVGPLPAGHPAGVKNAQVSSETAVIGVVGVAAAVSLALFTSGNTAPGTVTPSANAAAVVSTSTSG